METFQQLPVCHSTAQLQLIVCHLILHLPITRPNTTGGMGDAARSRMCHFLLSTNVQTVLSLSLIEALFRPFPRRAEIDCCLLLAASEIDWAVSDRGGAIFAPSDMAAAAATRPPHTTTAACSDRSIGKTVRRDRKGAAQAAAALPMLPPLVRGRRGTNKCFRSSEYY